MDYDVIINLIDEHNESGILLTEKFKPKEVIFIYFDKEDLNYISTLKEYYNNKFKNCNFLSKKMCKENLKLEIDEFLSKLKNKKILFNLNCGKRVENLILYTICLRNNIDCKYLDIEKEMLITFTKNNIFFEKNDFIDLGVEDVIKSIGGAIVVDSTDFCNLNIIEELTLNIAKNIELWKKYKIRLSDNTIFIHDESNPNFMKIDYQTLDNIEKDILNKSLEFLVQKNQIKIKEETDYIKIYFLNNLIKSFIFKSGTWLEVLTKNIVEKIEVIDDVKSGVLFLWNDEKTRVKNELDVVAIKDSVLICISCKDSKKYDEVALNELNVYANQLGGENVIKILVATYKPLKSSVVERAKEMDINLVIFDGDLNFFEEKLSNIINKINKEP
ncbi:Card1-like endonuclease domain-containing protein [Clostridium tarantellae]|uniref:DUF1887 family protein n=1 Tax=Clostridium tarantellae TaxID=39493 RepID=A0A6I1MK94_9CLOT|nr:DUF1887 family CARF protein [Clostridium tarantellae]MPQ42567.1 DUF1887 family protein [Clostridium tarantellae]